jgi:hypothetical protein
VVEIKVERGAPTPEELAAVVALVQARAAAAGSVAEDPAPLDAWGDPARNVPARVPPDALARVDGESGRAGRRASLRAQTSQRHHGNPEYPYSGAAVHRRATLETCCGRTRGKSRRRTCARRRR